ncbi:MAG: imidazolonepropionase [Bacteroidales bacterium]|nr:imidazolonepropionase [Bacteroidales bacterium]MBD5206586.1 imidazolonepropionase [Bacteroidales bacterium]MBD5224082.1 imidazolonepropionase [Bacteroidales bacterium]MBD5301886.1 imidazolonepropionase [Bacteroides sp.]
MSNLVILNANISTPTGNSAVTGAGMSELHHIANGAIIIENGIITYVGPQDEMPSYSESVEVIDAGGKSVLPGFVDSHTHLIFGGFRADEFEWRLKGDSYMSIMERGGGIQSTVNETRKADVNSLADKARWFIKKMSQMGVTTVEAKSGYGLDLDSELKMLDAIKLTSEAEEDSIRLVSTFLGAHAVPKEYKGRTGEYVNILIEEMIPQVKDKAQFFDIFTEKNVFEIDDSRKLLLAAKAAGMKLKLHADEIVTLGGAELAAEVGAVSADHLLHVSDEGIKRMAAEGVVATLLPLTAFALREPFAPARKFIEAGAAVALATDLNPGSCFSGSIPLTIALACIYMNMSIEETITALTLNGAAACGVADLTGSIEVGKSGDIVILQFDTYKSLPYYVGMNCVNTTIYQGKVVNK